MPANAVKTPRDERLWEKAKAQARKKKPAPKDFYAYVQEIYQQMKGEKAMQPILIKAKVNPLQRGNGSPKRSGTPKTDVERVMNHYGVSRKKALKMLKEKSASELLPQREARGVLKVNKSLVRTHQRRSKAGQVTTVQEHQRAQQKASHARLKRFHSEWKDLPQNHRKTAQIMARQALQYGGIVLYSSDKKTSGVTYAANPQSAEWPGWDHVGPGKTYRVLYAHKFPGAKTTKSTGEEPMDMQQFPALQKAINRTTLSKSLEFNKKGSEIKANIEKKIIECRAELAVMVIEWKAGLRIRSNADDAKCDEVPTTATATEPPEEPWNIRNKRREIEDMARVARNIVEGKTYKISEYELREYGF